MVELLAGHSAMGQLRLLCCWVVFVALCLSPAQSIDFGHSENYARILDLMDKEGYLDSRMSGQQVDSDSDASFYGHEHMQRDYVISKTFKAGPSPSARNSFYGSRAVEPGNLSEPSKQGSFGPELEKQRVISGELGTVTPSSPALSATRLNTESRLAELAAYLLSRGARFEYTADTVYGQAVAAPGSFYGHQAGQFYGHTVDFALDAVKRHSVLSGMRLSDILEYVKTRAPAELGDFTEEELLEALARADSIVRSGLKGAARRGTFDDPGSSGGAGDSSSGGGSSSSESSFYGFYGQDWSFYGKSELADWIRDHSESSFLDRLPLLSEIEDPRVRRIVKKLYDRFSSSSSSSSSEGDGPDKESSGGGGDGSSGNDDNIGSSDHNGDGYGQAEASVQRAAALVGKNVPSHDFYGVYGLHQASDVTRHHKKQQQSDLLSVSFTLSVTDYYPTQAESDELLFRIQRSIQEAAARLGVARYLEFAQISPPRQVGPDTVALDVEVVFNHNANGVYQLAQMLRENVIYVFPLTEYAGANVSEVKVSAYDPDMPPADLPYGASANVTGYAGQMAFNSTDIADSRVREQTSASAGGCALDRFSLNGSPNCCFSPFQLDARYECCKDPAGVDECGVCGGTGQTCSLQFSTRISVPADSDFSDVTSKAYNTLLQKYQQGIALLFSEFDFIASDVEISANTVSIQGGVLRRLLSTPDNYDQSSPAMQQLQSMETQTVDITASVEPRTGLGIPRLALAKKLFQRAADQKAQYEELQFLAVLEVKRVGVCFNGFCEVGEMSDPLNPSSASGTCPQDCPVTKLCPMPVRPVAGEAMKPCAGRGLCNNDAGTCACDSGYGGEACSKCAENYFLSGSVCSPACPLSKDLGSILVGDPDAVCGNRGICDSSARACNCEQGYSGPDCGTCAAGYSPRDGVCLWDTTLASIKDTSTGSGGSESSQGQSLAILVAASLTGGLALLTIAIFIYLKCQRREKCPPPMHEVSSARSSASLSRQIEHLEKVSLYPDGATSSHDPDLPTRQQPTNFRADIPPSLLASGSTSV